MQPGLKTLLKKAPFVPRIYHYFRIRSSYFLLSTILYWLSWNKATATLSLKRSGRFIPYLLVSISRAGYRIEIDDATFYPSDIIPLVRRNHLPIHATKIAHQQIPDKLLVHDHDSIPDQDAWKRRIKISYDYYNSHPNSDFLRMPYFMHPNAYYTGVFARVDTLRNRKRNIRICFAGTYDEDTYSAHFHFPMLNRYLIVERVLKVFAASITFLDEPFSISDLFGAENLKPIVMSISRSTENTLRKFALSYENYIGLLSRSHFFLAPPGVCVPWGHIVVEGMAVGSIPILNNTNFGWWPPLEHGKNCLAFRDEDELQARIRAALAMSTENILTMQANVSAYYEDYLKPESFATRFKSKLESAFTLCVDAEAETARLYELRSR